MIKNYSPAELEDFVNAIRNASLEIAKANPSFYMVSLSGGLPLFDILRIIDRNVDADKAIYFPTASRINNSSEVVTRCFENLFLERRDETNEPRVIASLDEVVSGASVEKVINSYNSASRRVARETPSQNSSSSSEDEAEKLRYKFPFKVFGIREMRPTGNKMNWEYLNRVKKKEILEFPTNRIITMDNPDFETVKFEQPNSSGSNGMSFYPKVREIVMKESYATLLSDIAKLVGVDPASFEPQRARIIPDCAKYSKKPVYK